MSWRENANARKSMAVSSGNTGSLRSMFENPGAAQTTQQPPVRAAGGSGFGNQAKIPQGPKASEVRPVAQQKPVPKSQPKPAVQKTTTAASMFDDFDDIAGSIATTSISTTPAPAAAPVRAAVQPQTTPVAKPVTPKPAAVVQRSPAASAAVPVVQASVPAPTPAPTPAATPAPTPTPAATSVAAAAPAPERQLSFATGTAGNSPAPKNSGESKWFIPYEELEFDELVSEGSAGEVYLGYWFGVPVAIKKLFELSQSEKHLVEREFQMLKEVNHPNIVQFLGLCDHESGVYLVTEYIENGDLFDLLVFEQTEVSWKNKVKLALQIAQACFYLHSRNIIHRDLKSQNVLIGDNFKVKLCDLGLATVTDNQRRMTMCGTNEWMAPEIVVAETYDFKVDIFSFGIVLTELILNKPPAQRDIAQKLQFDVSGFEAQLPPDCPPAFSALVVDCCKFEPADRPDFRAVVGQLRKLSNELPE